MPVKLLRTPTAGRRHHLPVLHLVPGLLLLLLSRSASASASSANVKRHTGGDSRWEAIQQATAQETALNLGHFRLLKRLGYGDIGSVYLVELRGTSAFFAMKVMDKASLISRNKMARAQTEREILVLLDHPFLPTLYALTPVRHSLPCRCSTSGPNAAATVSHHDWF